MVFGLFSRDEPSHAERNLEEMKRLGVDAISIVVAWVTPDVRSTELFPRDDMTPRDAALRFALREAGRLGMRTFLMPFIYVDRMGAGEWRGTIDPPDWDAWFAAYSGMILHYARLAEEEGVTYLSVGSELCSSESRTDAWRALIERVRTIYGGALTYSFNWDHREEAGFAGDLDYLGTNAYFELAEDPEAGVEELKSAWSAVIPRLEAWRAGLGKPLILTEVGYPSRRGAAVHPWDYTDDAPVDPEAQGRAYRAFVDSWAGAAGLAGVYFYLWWGEGGPADKGYTPRGKPAEKIVRDWYSASGKGEIDASE